MNGDESSADYGLAYAKGDVRFEKTLAVRILAFFGISKKTTGSNFDYQNKNHVFSDCVLFKNLFVLCTKLVRMSVTGRQIRRNTAGHYTKLRLWQEWCESSGSNAWVSLHFFIVPTLEWVCISLSSQRRWLKICWVATWSNQSTNIWALCGRGVRVLRCHTFSFSNYITNSCLWFSVSLQHRQ